MNAQLSGAVGVAVVGAGLYFRDRHLKAKFRGCRHCGRPTKRTFKMYPILVVAKGDGVARATGPIFVENGRVLFAVYKFSHCFHCGHVAMVESYDRWYRLASIKHRIHAEPLVFLHEPGYFREAGLTPCTTLNLELDTSVFGKSTFEERFFGIRFPWRPEPQQAVPS